ncbi:hypothetical protein SteCoe_10166 [Stentor coeruleus]|uniref:Trichohyalin-plectin-homology domain-containing protein n=1 Tax=Stentor coeruleus TaxID=5963 RepID=A0A1R2CGD9_9CILI|nr:hypothetical protein SteCoe_10166 [Stentor coeruleus]
MAEKPEEKKTFRKKVILPSDKDETLVKVKPKKMPNYDEKSANIRLNAAAILREEARLKKQEEEEKKRIANFMIDMRDDREFDKWQKAMRNKDEIDKIEKLQARKIEMELAREEAMEALKQKYTENKLLAAKIKETSKNQMEDMQIELEKELEDKKKQAVDIYESRVNIQTEIDKVKANKRKIKDELQKEIQEAVNQRKEEEALENARRDELIRQIRDLEKQPISRIKGFDPNEIMGFGLLEEMSLAQLKERLESRKKEIEEEIVVRREENIKNKEMKAQDLTDKVTKITEHRNIRAQKHEESKKKKQEDKEKKEKIYQEMKEKGLLTAYEKINAKKQARMTEQKKLEKELKEIKLKRQYLNANRALVEEKAWKEHEAGAEREAKDRQADALINQERVERIKLSEANLRAKAAKELAKQKVGIAKGYEATLAEAHEENEFLQREDRREKVTKHDNQKGFEETHKQKMEERQPYTAKINNTSIKNARTLSKK